MQDTLSIYTHVLGLVQPTTKQISVTEKPIHDTDSPIDWNTKGDKVYLNGWGGGITLTDVLKNATTNTNGPDEVQLQNLIFDWVKTQDESEITQFHPLNAVAVLDPGNPKRPKVSISGSTAIWDLWQNHICGLYRPDRRDQFLKTINLKFAANNVEVERLKSLWVDTKKHIEAAISEITSDTSGKYNDSSNVCTDLQQEIAAIDDKFISISTYMTTTQTSEIYKAKQEYDLKILKKHRDTLTSTFENKKRKINQTFQKMHSHVRSKPYSGSPDRAQLEVDDRLLALAPYTSKLI